MSCSPHGWGSHGVSRFSTCSGNGCGSSGVGSERAWVRLGGGTWGPPRLAESPGAFIGCASPAELSTRPGASWFSIEAETHLREDLRTTGARRVRRGYVRGANQAEP